MAFICFVHGVLQLICNYIIKTAWEYCFFVHFVEGVWRYRSFNEQVDKFRAFLFVLLKTQR